MWSKNEGVNSFLNNKICFSNIKLKVASRYSVNIIIIIYYFFIIGSSLMVELSLEFSCKLSCENSLPIHVDYFLWLQVSEKCCMFTGHYFFINLFYFFCCRLSSTQRILTFLCKMFLVKRLIIRWSSSINKGVFICELKYLIKYAR